MLHNNFRILPLCEREREILKQLFLLHQLTVKRQPWEIQHLQTLSQTQPGSEFGTAASFTFREVGEFETAEELERYIKMQNVDHIQP